VLKFQPTQPAADRYAFDAADRYVQFGLDRHMQVVGHNLVWHSQTGAWVFEGADGTPADRETLLARMRDHIRTVVGRYRGKIHGWDVVNEAVDEDGSLRKSPWQAGMGDDYIAKAFEFAHEADPDAELYYKRIQSREAGQARRRQQARSRSAGAQAAHRRHRQPGALAARDADHRRDRPVAGRAVRHRIEGHVHRARHQPLLPNTPRGADPAVANPYANGLPAEIQQQLARRYADVFRVFLKHRDAVTRVTFWGLSDADSC